MTDWHAHTPYDQRLDLGSGYVVYLTRYASGWAMALYHDAVLVAMNGSYLSDSAALEAARGCISTLEAYRAA